MGAAGFPLRLLPFLNFCHPGPELSGAEEKRSLGRRCCVWHREKPRRRRICPLLGGAEGQSTAAAVFAADVSEKFSFPGRQNLTGMHPEDFCKIGLNLFCTIGAEKSDSGEKRPLSR